MCDGDESWRLCRRSPDEAAGRYLTGRDWVGWVFRGWDGLARLRDGRLVIRSIRR